MTELVFDEVPDDPPALDGWMCTCPRRQDDFEVFGTPALEAIADEIPRFFESVDEFRCRPRLGFVVLPTCVAERQVHHCRAGDTKHVAHRGRSLAEDVVEPV